MRPYWSEGLFGNAFDARCTAGFPARVEIVADAADLDRVLRGAVARCPDEVEVERLAQPVKPRGDLRLLADAGTGAGRREESRIGHRPMRSRASSPARIGTTSIGVHFPGWAGQWFSLFANVQTIVAQVLAVGA